jgi:hypothetical protein
MPDDATSSPPPPGDRPRGRLPRYSELRDVTDETIAFADLYQQVWEQEAKATIALGEFLQARSESLRIQVQLMRMGTGAFRRYSDWSTALFGVRPETFMDSLVDQAERLGFGAQQPPAQRPRRRTSPE